MACECVVLATLAHPSHPFWGILIDFVWRNVPGMFRGVGVCCLTVKIKIEIIDFLQPRIKQILRENIITPEKCVIGIDYVHP